MTNFPQQLKGIAIGTIFFIGLLYVSAWTGAPTGTPPANNVDAPVNVSINSQYKDGALGVGGLIRGYADAIFDGGVKIGTTTDVCSSALGGTLRYNSSARCVEFCDESSWKCTNQTATPPTCTSFTYSSWSPSVCVNGTQTRTVTTSLPSGCVGGTSSTSQSCTVPDFSYTATISDTPNYNLRDVVLAAGWDGSKKVVATITINGDVYSTSNAIPAFDTGDLPAGSSVTIINNGNIIGKGGNGGVGYGSSLWAGFGYAYTVGTPGEDGGPALKVRAITVIRNYGVIAGGGGGGGGGGYAYNNYYYQNYGSAGGGGGGGGQGYNAGSAGGGGILSGYSSASGNSGSSGTFSSAGLGATAVNSSNSQGDGAAVYGSAGGNGGTLGNPGQVGGSGSAQYASGGYPGGLAGNSVIGNSYVSWEVVGTRLGPVN